MYNTNAGHDFTPEPLRRAQTFYSPIWDEPNLLSLDGGGIRGYWTLLVLELLMQAVGDEERAQATAAGVRDVSELHSFLPEKLPDHVTHCSLERRNQKHTKELDAQRFLPCHYFDLICGSSTGSLIAIMLVRFRMTVRDCLQEYEEMSNLVFGKPRPISQRNVGFVTWPKYDAKAMSNAFKEVTRRRGEKLDGSTDTHPPHKFETKTGTCSVLATTIRTKQKDSATVDTLHLLRSYRHDKILSVEPPCGPVNYGEPEPLEIWKVARAATAAPFYFNEFIIDEDKKTKEKLSYSDGGFGHTNNPTSVGIYELHDLYSQDGERAKLGAIVSIGTSRADNMPSGKGIFKRVKKAFTNATDPQHVACQVAYYHPTHYWRLNDSRQGLNIELDEWKPGRSSDNPGHKTLAKIRNAFREWAQDRDNAEMIRNCAYDLVRRRRVRALDRSKWERYAIAAEFQCKYPQCNTVHELRHRFEAHFRDEHEQVPDAHLHSQPKEIRWAYASPS